MSLHKKIRDNLISLDVSKHIEKKMNLSYLSWTWAWQTFTEYYPQAEYEFKNEVFSDSTMEVICKVTVKEGDEVASRQMWLPVMDNRNNAIKNPNARQISDAKMRCLVKTIAMFGLGLYIYAGEDLPEQKQEKQALNELTGAQVNWIKQQYYQEGRGVTDIVSQLESKYTLPNQIKKTIADICESTEER